MTTAPPPRRPVRTASSSCPTSRGRGSARIAMRGRSSSASARRTGSPHLHRAVLEGVAFAADAPPAHHGESRRPQDRARHRFGRRRQDEALAEDQGERLRRSNRSSEGAGMRRRWLRRDGGDRGRSFRSDRGRGRKLTSAMSTRSKPDPDWVADLCADAAGVRPALRPLPGALRRSRRPCPLTQELHAMDEILAPFAPTFSPESACSSRAAPAASGSPREGIRSARRRSDRDRRLAARLDAARADAKQRHSLRVARRARSQGDRRFRRRFASLDVLINAAGVAKPRRNTRRPASSR